MNTDTTDGVGPNDESAPYNPKGASDVTSQPRALSGPTSLILFDTYPELRTQSGGMTPTSTNVAIGRDAGIGGTFAWSTDMTSSDDGGTICVPHPRTGCWKRVFQGSLSVKWFGALGDGVDDNDAVKAAVVRANSLNIPVFFPPGTYRVEYVGLYSNTVLIGAGKEQTVIHQASGSTGALMRRETCIKGVLQYCSIRDLKLLGNDGAGGSGLHLDSFANCVFESLVISTFRTPREALDHSGIGLKLANSDQGGTHTNNFVDITIADCDTGLLMDSTRGGLGACGYNRFFGLKVYQQVDCIVLKNTSTNGSIYNMFSGVLLQGTASGGKGVYCEGSSNTFLNLVVDGVPGNHIELKMGASGNVFLNPSVAGSKIFNSNTSGAQNTIYGAGTISGGLGQPFVLSDVLTGQTTLSLAASGSRNGPEIRLATDASPIMWRLAVQNGGIAAFLSLSHRGDVVEQWRTDLSSTKYGNLTVEGAIRGTRHMFGTQAVAAASSLIVAPSSGGKIRINLSATAITSLAIMAGNDGEFLYVAVAQDGTGGRTIPTTWKNVKFAGGMYTASAQACKIDVLQFVYDSTVMAWLEVSRALNI